MAHINIAGYVLGEMGKEKGNLTFKKKIYKGFEWEWDYKWPPPQKPNM